MLYLVYLEEGTVGWYCLEACFLVGFVISVCLAFLGEGKRSRKFYLLFSALIALTVGSVSIGLEYVIRNMINDFRMSAFTQMWENFQTIFYSVYQFLYYGIVIFGSLIYFRYVLKIPTGKLLIFSLIAFSFDVCLKAAALLILLQTGPTSVAYLTLALLLVFLNALFGLFLYFRLRKLKGYAFNYAPALCLFIVAFAIDSLLLIVNQFNHENALFYGVGLLLFAFPFGILAYLYADRSQKAKEYADLQRNYDLEKTNEAAKENAQQDVRLALHDLRHFIHSFDGKVPPEQIENMEKALDNYNLKVKTPRETLNYVLGSKSDYAASHQINFTFSGDSNDLAFLTDEDLYSLFENILSNAFEAVSKLPEVSKRVVSVNLKKQGNMVILSELNYYEGNLVYQDRQLETTKEDKTIHGFGMKSIQAVMDTYDGTLTTSAKGGIFELTVIFPGDLARN